MKRFHLMSAAALAFLAAQSLFAGPEAISSKDSKTVVEPAPMPAQCHWTGFYIGGHVGYTWGGDASFLEEDENDPPFTFDDVQGFVGGGQAGFNLQLGEWFVIGIEGTFASFDIDDSDTNIVGNEETHANYDRGDWLATIGGRAGVSFWRNKMLAYFKGAVGFANWDFNTREINSDERFHVGDDNECFPVFGFGLEYAITCHWSVRVEYNHLFSEDHERVIGIETEGTRREERAWHSNRDAHDLVTSGVNFKF